MQIYLLRHGDAIPQGYDDVNRSLSHHGEVQIQNIANILVKQRAKIDLVLSSPLMRAKQTAEIVNHKLNVNEVLITEYLIPGNDHRQIMEELNRRALSNVLLVGHEPHLSAFISILISGSRSSGVGMGKGSLALIECAAPIKPGRGILRWLLSPELIV